VFRKILAIGVITLFLASWTSIFGGNMSVVAAGATIYVDDSNTGGPWDGTILHPYQNITSGLEYASFGDTVYVFGGTYSENVVLNKSVTLMGDSKPSINGLGGIGINITVYDNFVYGVAVDGFNITNCSYGIYLVMQDIAIDVTDFSVITGDIILNNNTISSNSDGIFIDISSVGNVMYGNSSVAIGDLSVANNVIKSSGKGINVDRFKYIGNDMFDKTAFSAGNIEITGNTVNSSQQGIYLDEIVALGQEMYDDSRFTMGSILVNDNTVDSDDYGIAPWGIRLFGIGLHGNSSFTMGNIEFCRNTINSTIDAIGFSQFTGFGIDIYGNSSFSMGSILVNDNTLRSIIWLTSFGSFGSGLYENSSCTMGNVEFCRNKIYTDWADGITFYDLQPFGNEMYGYSLFTMGDFSVNDNVIVTDGTRSGISCAGGFGTNIHDNAVAITGSFEFEGNDISFAWCGLNLWKVKDALARNNTIWNSMYGIYLPESASNHIYHNNFINNTIQAYVTPNYNNTWDNGYPSGGNYWSDYTGTDLYSGPDQNMPGSDFRGDTPYAVNQNNTDHYPLTIPYETQPPTIVILSPENTTYAVDTDLQLTFTLDEPVDWIGYSLDDESIVAITGNITLPTLPVGGHHVSVYANDTFNNMGVGTIYFTVFDFTDPVADAGSDRTVNEDVPTTLDGSGSTDNVGITSYTWTFTDVTVKTLTGDKPTYTFSNPGVYTITLSVTDAAGNWAIDTVVITVLDVTDPVANAGQDQTVNVGETVSFDAGGSTDNVGIVSYEWDFGDETSGTGKTVTHEYANAGTYTVTLTVEDAAGNQATDTVVVTVNLAEAFPWWIAAAGIVAVGVVVAAAILWRRRKKSSL
jgi:parallel beta-helix repeat protein